MSDSNSLTAQRLRELLDYDPGTGLFTWKVDRANGGARAGDVCRGAAAGDHGCRRQVHIDGRHYYLHRLAWLHVHGSWPKHTVDHINGDQNDNRIVNLRDVPNNINAQNKRRPAKTNTHGFLGVQRNGKRWKAEACVDGKRYYFGTYDSPEEAHRAYVEAKRWIHDGCTL